MTTPPIWFSSSLRFDFVFIGLSKSASAVKVLRVTTLMLGESFSHVGLIHNILLMVMCIEGPLLHFYHDVLVSGST